MAVVAEPVTRRARVNTYRTRDGGDAPVELAYDVFGERGMPLVLVMGIGAQRIFWSEAFCAQFVAAGFQVVRFDHRDIGQSTRLEAATPKPLPLLARSLLNLPVHAPYSLSDMAADVVGLLDHLGWASAHVVGASLGGMVAQHLALEHPTRVRSVTTIMTTPGGRRYMPKVRAFRALFAPSPKTAVEAGAHVAKMFQVIGSTAWPTDVARLEQAGALAFERGLNPRGFLRHFAGVLASGDRRSKLATIAAPTLVIHGSSDPMFPLSAGRKIAASVQHGTWLPIAGMGHDLPTALWPTIVRALAKHAKHAESLRGARGGT
ncbi:MAG: alpha/beta hydrolase [Kofleriaceae bacterium]